MARPKTATEIKGITSPTGRSKLTPEQIVEAIKGLSPADLDSLHHLLAEDLGLRHLLLNDSKTLHSLAQDTELSTPIVLASPFFRGTNWLFARAIDMACKDRKEMAREHAESKRGMSEECIQIGEKIDHAKRENRKITWNEIVLRIASENPGWAKENPYVTKSDRRRARDNVRAIHRRYQEHLKKKQRLASG